MSVIIKSLSGDFSGSLDTTQLKDTINEAGTIGPECICIRNKGGDNVQIIFNSPLSVPSETDALDTIISGYTPVYETFVDFTNFYHYAESTGESSTTSTSFQEKVSLVTTVLPLGQYQIEFSSEISNTSSGFTYVKVEVNDSSIAEYNLENDNDWPSLSGFKGIELSGINTIILSYRTNHKRRTAKIRNARLKLYRVA